MPNEFDTNKNQLDLFSYAESKQNQQDKRQKLASSGFTATVWTLSGVVLAACSLFEDDEGLGGGSVSVNASPVRDARLYFDIDGDGDVDEEDVRIQNEQYPGGFITGADGRATGIPIELLGRPYIALLDGAVDDATEQELEGQYSSLEDEDGNHLIASPITDLIADAIADTNQPNTVPGVVAEFTPSSVDAADILAELRNRDSYLPNTDDYSPRIVAVSKYLADNQAREVLGREDDLNTQIMEVERILGEVTTPDALIIVSEDSDNDPTNGVQVEMEVGEHDTYIGLVNAVSGDNTLTFRFVNANGDEMEVPGYTINPRGVISAVTPEGETSPTNTATMPNTPLRISVSDGTNTEIVEVAITVQPAYELVIVQEDATEVVAASVDVEENDMGAMIAVVIRSDEPATQHTDFEIRDDFPDSFNILADKFMIEAVTGSPGTFNLRLKTGEYLDYEAFRTFDLHISALESGTPSNELTITVMVGNVDDISFSGTLRANLREDVDVQANDELIAEGEVTIANNLDANGNPLPVVLSSTLSSGPATFTGDAAGVEMTQLDYGTFTYNHATNAWSYVVNNDLAAVQALKTGETLTEIVTLTIDDPDSTITHTRSITLNILGENEDVHYVDTITRNRVDGSDVSIEIGDPAINGMLDLGNVFDGLMVQNQLAGSTPPTVTFAETDNADVLARQNLFTLSPDGALVFVGNDDDVANLLRQGIALELVISAPDDTNEPIPFRLSINVVNDDDNGPAAYEIMGEVRENVALSVMRISDDPDTLRGTETYQWFLGDENNPVALLGTGPTYTVTAADLASGETIGVAVSYTDGSGTTYDGVGGNPNPIYAFASPVSFTSPAIADRRIDLDEDTRSGSTAHFTVQAESEDDAGAPVGIASYELLDENRMVVSEYKGFTINSSTGVITLTGSLDYEMDEVITLRVRATDMNSPAETATLTLTVNVGDVNDNAPVFDPNQVTTVAIDETLGNGQSVGLSVAATDADGTSANRQVSYSVTGGTGMGIFDVDSSSGVITVLDASMIDYESGTTSYTLIIGASDGLDANGTDDPTFTADTTTTITINITDINDESPSVLSHADTGTARITALVDNPVAGNGVGTGYTVTVSDADADASSLDVSVTSGDPRFEFVRQVGTNTWELYLIAGREIAQSELNDQLTFEYTVTDNGVGTTPVINTFTINVVDSSVSFDSGFERDYDIPETTSYTAGELVVQVSATSVTPGNPTITYAFETGNPDNDLFDIDPTTGRITWAANTAFDYEALTADERIGQVVVIATEVAGSGDTNAGTGNTARVTITGTVINEQEGDGTYIIEGNVAAGGRLNAVVNDPDGTRSVTYEWYSLDSSGGDRQVIAATQSIRLPGAADFDDTRTYHVTITHTDNLGHTPVPMTLDASAVQFNIQKTLTDNTAFPDSIAENTDSLPVVVATLDGDTRSPTYTFVGGDTITTSGVFTISQSGSTAGAITVNAPSDINFETAQEFNDGSRGYTLNVRATFAEDTANNLPEVTGDVVVTIIVTDVNEHAPVFVTNADDNTLSTGTDEIAEDAANGTRVGLFRATDADGSNNDVTYSLDDGGLGVFGIREVTGTNNWEIYVLDNTRLDFESATKSYTIEITATDSDPDTTTRKSSGAEAFTINITDVNDNDPVLSATPVWEGTLDFGVPENTGTNVHLFTVSATDADENPSLTYEIVSIDGVALASIANPIFGIDASDGRVGLAGQLDRETKASHEIVIRAVDEGGRASNEETFTVTVGDVNEHKPVLGEPEWVSDYGDNGVPEDAYTGAPLQIFTATATDRDATNNGFSYEIVSVDGVTYDSSTSIFAIRAGRVGITSALDYATAPEIMDDTNTVIGRGHEIVIVAIDNSGTGMRSEPGTITVLVANRDDGPAVFEVSPTQANDKILEVEVDMADPDGLNGTYSYQWFTTTDDGVTQVDITNENGRRFDTTGRTDPTGTVYGVRVEYTDNAGTEYSQANGNAPFAVNTTLRFTESYSITLTDGDASPTLPVFADDLELNGDAITTGLEFTFATNGNPGNLFTLSSAGVLTFTGSAVDFDMATDAEKSFNLIIVAEATAGGETTTAIIPVTVEDVNDNDPTLSEPFDTADVASDPRTTLTADSIDENATGAATSISFEASDADTVFSGAGQTALGFTITATAGTTDAQDIADMFEMVYDSTNDIYTLRLKDGMALNAEAAGLTTNSGVQQIELRIQATDGRTDMPTATPTAGQGLSDARTVTITVNDVNDFDPVFRNGPEHTETISEEMAVGTTVVSTNPAPARDGDATAANRDLEYSIVRVTSGGVVTGAEFFTLDTSTGGITLAQKLDYESTGLISNASTDRGYVIELLVKDQDDRQDTQMLTVVVTDEDDTDPEFGTLDWNAGGDDPSDPGSRLIDENTTGTLLTIPISDADTVSTSLNANLEVSIQGGSPVDSAGEPIFVFVKSADNLNAELRVNPMSELDFEHGTTYTLTLVVADARPTPGTATQTVTINVNNINEETPTFTNNPIVTWETGFELGIIPETTDVSGGRVLVGRVAISDDDGATNFLDDRTFAIAGAGAKFEIERNADVGTNGGTLGEGLIYLNAALDREGVGADDAEYDAVKITVTDGTLPAVTSDAFSIFIDDVNEGDPVIAVTGSPASFTERTASGNEATGVTFTISDADTGSTYTSSEIALSGDSRFDFVWDEAMQSGTVVLKDTETLDHDAATNPDRAITLTLTVTDPLDASVTDTETITINVGNADDVASELGTLTWQAGTGSGVAGEEHIRTIAENQGSAPILVMSVSDPDTATASLTPTIQGGSPVDASNNPIFSFGILNNQAILSVLSSRLDYETAPNTYTLVLEVSDGTNTPAATQTVTINVGNVNEHDPVFGADLVDFGTSFGNGGILENTVAGTVIGVVDVSDADGDVLTVTVLPGLDTTTNMDVAATTAAKFEVVYNMMDDQYELRLKTALDLEGANPDPAGVFGLRLRATDGTNSVDSPTAGNKQIPIEIRNVDDADPVFNDTHITWNVGALNIRGVDANTIAVFEYVVDGTTTSGAPAGRKLADLAASDPDTSGALAYSIDNGPQIGGVDIFEIGGANNDELLLKTALDYEAAEDLGGGNRGYTLTLTVSDGRMGVNPVSHEVTIRVLNADEGKAEFAALTSSGDVTAPAVGDELTFTPTPTTADPDGNPVAPNTFTRTWYRENPDGTGLDTITNASDTYTITSADVGKIVGVIVNYIDGGGTEYLGTAGVKVELANVVVSDFTADAASLRGEAMQYNPVIADASGTFTYDDTGSADTKAKVTAAGTTVSYAIKTGGESAHGTADINSATGAWTFNVNNKHADVLALNADDTDTTNDSLTTKFTVEVSVTTGGVTEKFDQDVSVTINAVSEVRGTAGTDTGTGSSNPLDRSQSTTFEVIQGGENDDEIKVGSGGSVVFGSYGDDAITLSATKGVVDTVVIRFTSAASNGWVITDGADVITNFELGVDKIVFVDTHSGDAAADFDTFTDRTKSGENGEGKVGALVHQTEDGSFNVLGIHLSFPITGDDDGPGGATTRSGKIVQVNWLESVESVHPDTLAGMATDSDADNVFWSGPYFTSPDLSGSRAELLNFDYLPSYFSGKAPNTAGSDDNLIVTTEDDLMITILDFA